MLRNSICNSVCLSSFASQVRSGLIISIKREPPIWALALLLCRRERELKGDLACWPRETSSDDGIKQIVPVLPTISSGNTAQKTGPGALTTNYHCWAQLLMSISEAIPVNHTQWQCDQFLFKLQELKRKITEMRGYVQHSALAPLMEVLSLKLGSAARDRRS